MPVPISGGALTICESLGESAWNIGAYVPHCRESFAVETDREEAGGIGLASVRQFPRLDLAHLLQLHTLIVLHLGRHGCAA